MLNKMKVYIAVFILVLQVFICCCFSKSVDHIRSEIVYNGTIGGCSIILREGDDVCQVVKELSSAATTETSNLCSHIALYDELVQHLLPLPQVLSKVMIGESFLIDCSSKNSQICDRPHYRNIRKFDRTAFLERLIEILEDHTLGDEAALHKFIFEYERDAVKLTSLESLGLFFRAYIIRPNNSLILNRLGQSLQLVGRDDLTNLLYEQAVQNGLWPHKLQRPEWDYTSGLTSKPWHESSNFTFSHVLEKHYAVIRGELEEYLLNNFNSFANENENFNTFSGGDWTALVIKSDRGYSDVSASLPETTRILRNISEDFLLVKFSALRPGTHILPHTGPSNNRLRAHFCISHTGGAWFRVGEEWRTWQEGKVFVIDSSWEHEVLHNGPDLRIVLILDIWHPEYTVSMNYK